MGSKQINRQQFTGYTFAIGATAIWSANFIIARGDFSRLLNLTFAIGDFWMLLASIIFAVSY